MVALSPVPAPRRPRMDALVHNTAAPARSLAQRAATVPWYLFAALSGSTAIVVGLLWDISWHATIGRDTFWTPAHMVIYLGGTVGGLVGGWLAFKTTFFGTAEERAASVRVWRMR